MAALEADYSDPNKTNPGPDDSLIIKTGKVTYRGQGHSLIARAEGLAVLKLKSSQETPVLQLSWQDVVCAHGSETSQSTSQEVSSSGTVMLHHVRKSEKSNKLRCDAVTLQICDEEQTREWIDLIEDRRKEGKPRKLLVIINPIGGKGQGRQTFEKEVKPLFDLAGIETVVKVTDHYRHAVEIASTYDLSSVDGVVVAGGDGFFAEVLQGMMQQTQQRAGINLDDPDATLQPPPVPIALLPTGTGNGVCGWVNGDIIDVVTSALNVVRGRRTKINMMTIHDQGRLVHYCGLRVTYGFFAQMMKRTDEKRWMKRARYPYALLTSVLWKKLVFDIEVDILQTASPEPNKPGDGQGETTANPKWISLGRKSITNLMGWVAEFQPSEADHLVFNPFTPHADLILHSSTSGVHYLGFLFKMVARKKDMFDSPSIERYSRVVGFRFRFVGQRASATGQGQGDGASASNPPSEKDLLSRSLDVDGELMESEVSAVDCRLLNQFVPVFGIRYVPA